MSLFTPPELEFEYSDILEGERRTSLAFLKKVELIEPFPMSLFTPPELEFE